MSQLYEYFDVTGGGQTLEGYAFPDVHKFDASSFYNWEQDNLPILDLETRSNVLRQYLGLTDVTGVTLTVSADAPKSASALGVYQTVQDALEVVPRRLRFPLLIEICDYGNLGDLSLADIHCEGDGALQIESRQYAVSYRQSQVSGVESTTEAGPAGTTQTVITALSDTNPFPIGTLVGYPDDSLSANFYTAESTNLGIPCFSLEGWSRNGRIFASVQPDSQNEAQTITFAPQYNRDVSSLFPGGSLAAANHYYTLNPYSTTEESTIALDANPKTQNGTGESLIASRDVPSVGSKAHSVWWGAYFNKVEIKNCSKIKLKNICVDSASGLDSQYPRQMSYLCDTGISITNSNVLLENIAVCRVRKTGVSVQDSTVSLRGDFVIHRVYERNLDGTRPSEGVGLFATDSNIVFNPLDVTEIYSLYKGWGAMRNISKCGVGISLNNSLLTGGSLNEHPSYFFAKNAGVNDPRSTRLYLHGNQTAMKLTNSTYDLDGRTEVFCNINGIEAYQSNLIFQQFSVDSNQEKGFYLNHSNLFYGKNSDTLGVTDTLTGGTKPAFACDYNGINIHADKNSSIAPHEDVEIVPRIARWGGKTGRVQDGAGKWIMSNHGTYGLGAYKAPNIILNNNSNAEFAHLAVAFNGAAAGVAGACVQVSENSQAVFRGTGRSATCLGSYGNVTLKSNWTTAAVAALDNSEVVFTGPTKIARAGVGVLAQNNSRAAFGPPTQDHTVWTPANERFQLSSTDNHTKVDIHANRACLVANEKSLIEIKSLGGSALDVPNSTDISQTFDASTTFVESTSGSYIRFSPNGFTEQLAESYYEADSFDIFDRDTDAFADSGHEDVTTGGMCVRAVGASKVDVNMTNFRIGTTGLPGQVSGVCYNYNGTGCEYGPIATSGIAASPAFNICDLVTSCCDPVATTTSTAATTTTTTAAPTTTTTVTGTITVPTIESPTETWKANILETVVDMGQEGNNVEDSDFKGVNYEFSCVGSRIHMWNIADTSRMHAANLLLNGSNPETTCINNSFHGPTGRWANGAACDYYGKLGFAASALSEKALGSQVDGFYNLGVFRVVGSHRGYLKTYSEIDYQGLAINSQMTQGGSPMDQVNSQGYQTMFDLAINTPGAEDNVSYHAGLEPGSVSGAEPVFGRGLAGERGEPGKINGVMTHARMVEGQGMKWDEGELHPIFPFPPLHLGWQGYIRNWLDESAANVFANARHGASKKVNLLSIYRASTSSNIGGEGRDTTTGNPTFGVGVRSLNMFDLNRLV